MKRQKSLTSKYHRIRIFLVFYGLCLSVRRLDDIVGQLSSVLGSLGNKLRIDQMQKIAFIWGKQDSIFLAGNEVDPEISYLLDFGIKSQFQSCPIQRMSLKNK